MKIKLFLAIWVLSSCFIKAQLITTVAGGGAINIGDGGQADSASLKHPVDVITDAAGNIYISDQANHRIRKIDPSGIITTIAGKDSAGFSGDGGQAALAKLNYPAGIFLDTAGNLFIVDELNHRIRKVNTAGIINTIAGTGTAGYNGDGGLATLATLNKPFAVYVDKAGNVYIADTQNNRIRKINTGGIISTVAGIGVAGFSGDNGLATNAMLRHPVEIIGDTLGNFYLSDYNNFRVRKINSSGIITTIAGTSPGGYSGDGGPAINAKFDAPMGLFKDKTGNIFISDFNNNCIRKIDTFGIVNRVVGTTTAGFSGDGGQGILASLYQPSAITIDLFGNTFVADNSNNRIRKVDITGIISTVAGGGNTGIGNGGLSTSAVLDNPDGVVFDKLGNMYIPEFYGNRIRKVDPSGIITTFAGTGTAGYSGNGGQANLAQLNAPQSIRFDTSDNMYFAETNNNIIRKINMSTGIITTAAGTGVAGYNGDGIVATTAKLNQPLKICLDKSNNIYIGDGFNYRIRKVNQAGIISTIAGVGIWGFTGDGGLATIAQVAPIEGLVFDSLGNLLICDGANNRVRKIDTFGIINTIAGTGIGGFSGDGGLAINAKLNYPDAVIFDKSGNLYVCDGANNRIRKIDTSGIITTVVGNGIAAFSGDGGLPTLASINTTNDFCFDTIGNLYIADMYNMRIRKVTNVTVGVNEIKNKNSSFNISPNPSSSNVTLTSSKNMDEIKVRDMLGQTVSPLSLPTGEKVFSMNISTLENGIYFITITSVKESSTQKLIVQH